VRIIEYGKARGERGERRRALLASRPDGKKKYEIVSF